MHQNQQFKQDSSVCATNMTDTSQKIREQDTCTAVKTLDFPFLQNPDTVTFIKMSKIMILIKGLPGSGKSHLAREISKVYRDCVICCADNLRPPDLKNPYPKDVLTASHKRCTDVAEEAAKKGVHVIVVDNSNLRQWEMQPYLNIAKEYNYTEIVAEPKTSWKWNPVELAAKSTQVRMTNKSTQKL